VEKRVDRPSSDVGTYDCPGNELTAEMQMLNICKTDTAFQTLEAALLHAINSYSPRAPRASTAKLLPGQAIRPRRLRGVCVTLT